MWFHKHDWVVVVVDERDHTFVVACRGGRGGFHYVTKKY